MPRVAVTPTQRFNNRFSLACETSMRDPEMGKSRTTHTAIAKKLGMTTRNWLYLRKDPADRIKVGDVQTVAEMLGWDEEILGKIFGLKKGA